METIVRHIFSTLTYDRSLEVLLRWQSVSQDFNRYIQRLRRLHNSKIEYFRVVEEHKDSFPHVHVLLQFPSAVIRCSNDRYFDRALYQKWKSLWTHGYSDYQKPRRDGLGTLSYLMKYLIKNQTSKTIWRKILSNSTSVTTALVDSTPTPLDSANIMDVPAPQPTHLNGVKLASWSRNFDWTPLRTPPSK